MSQVAGLQKDLPPADRRRLTQYLDDVREIERRIQRAEASAGKDLALPDVPSRRAGDVPGASEAPHGSPGDRAAGGHHPRLDADVRARAEHGGVSGDEHPRPVP